MTSNTWSEYYTVTLYLDAKKFVKRRLGWIDGSRKHRAFPREMGVPVAVEVKEVAILLDKYSTFLLNLSHLSLCLNPTKSHCLHGCCPAFLNV